jgi:predicted DCC family thiol-disulfide oxidoreductase YuxK
VLTRLQLHASRTSSSGSAERDWLLYDADCGLCKFIVARVLELSDRFRPLALQDPRAGELLPGLDSEERMLSFHVVDASGTVHSAGAGLARILSPLRRFPRLSSRLYWLVAGNRDRLGKLLPGVARRQADRRIRARSDAQ